MSLAGLKKHAVTMFEVGQLRDDQIDALTEELRLIDGRNSYINPSCKITPNK
jgi:hypothetical protein